jgi:hypothetical protein
MIKKKHPSVGDSNFDILHSNKRRRAHRLRVKKTLKQFLQFIFLDLHPGDTCGAFTKGTKLEKFLSRFDLYRFKGDSMCYSVLFYQKTQ